MSLLIHPKRGPKGSSVGKVHSVAYHRNGVCGESFWRVEFNHGSGSTSARLIAIVTFEGNPPNAKLIEAYVIHPTMGDSDYRGTDAFGPALMTVINSSKWPHEVTVKSVPLIQS